MFNTKFAWFGVLVLCMVGGITASTASALGPYWHANGTKITQGIKQLKMQNKGAIIFKYEDHVMGTVINFECKNDISEGAAIEGNGNKQGQGKGRLSFAQCKSPTEASCKVAEPITTNQLKSYLVTYESSDNQLKDAYVFAPTQTKALMTIAVTGCTHTEYNVQGVVEGTVAAAVLPAETEAQEGLLSTPELSIGSVFHEQVQEGVALTFPKIGFGMRFTYGMRLASGERFGVFGQ